MSDVLKETLSITTFERRPFMNDLRIETEDGKALSTCAKVDFM